MTAPVDFAALELHKENILPLASGRSAAQLVQLATQTRSGLGDKLTAEHTRFEAAIDALDRFDTGIDIPGWDPVELAALADDPLDLHHQYARFVLNAYPAGPSAASRLLPLLERSTRKFLHDQRYRNDPRYLRLWNLYAKNIDSPEECYRFLFAKGVGERLAVLYEEYALVLEAAGKRQQADQVYLLGVARQAVPLDRLKKRHLAFQARMLVAPPLPDSPPRVTAISRDVRSILAGSAIASTPAVAGKENGAKGFAVFQDGEGSKGSTDGSAWNDFGTVRSRKRENEIDATEWKGETLPMGGKQIGGGGGFKLDVFRDNDAPPTPSAPVTGEVDVLTRSLRGPSEGELLRQNPFKNYPPEDLSLSTIDPLEALPSLPVPPVKPRAKSSSSSKKGTTAGVKVPSTGTERVACDLKAIYPSPGVEISFEELKWRSRGGAYVQSVESWNGWEAFAPWKEEVERTGVSSYLIDPATGWPRLRDLVTAAPLWEFVRQADLAQAAALAAAELLANPPPLSPSPIKLIRSPSPVAVEGSPLRLHPESSSPLASPSTPSKMERVFRQPSPTINTRQAQAMVDNLFSKTLNFDLDRDGFGAEEEEDEADDDDEEEEEEEEGEWNAGPGESQPDGGSQSFSQEDEGSGFSQAHSQEQGAHNVVSSQKDSQWGESQEVAMGDENGPPPSAVTRLVAPPSTPAFRPTTRIALGAKPVGRAFQVARDEPVVVEGAGIMEEDEEVGDEEYYDEYESAFTRQQRSNTDGFDMGRRAVGTNRYAPLIDNMTPIVERTGEYSHLSSAKTPRFGGFGQTGPRVSVAPEVGAVVEDDEDEDDEEEEGEEREIGVREGGSSSDDSEEEDEDAGDQAFVGAQGASTEEESDEEPDTEEDEEVVQPRALVPSVLRSIPPVTLKQSPSFPSDITQSNSTDSPLRAHSVERSFDASPGNASSTSLPEGYTIIGNQSGMITNLLLADTTVLPDVTDKIAQLSLAASTDGSTFPNPCNPFNAVIMSQILSRCSPPLLRHPQVHDLLHSQAHKLEDLQKVAKRRGDKGPSSSKQRDRTGVIEEIWALELDGEQFSVAEKLGEGAFGAVFRVTALSGTGDRSMDDDDDDEMEDEISFAVKVERPTNRWEFYMLDQLHQRLPQQIRPSVVKATSLYAYQDESFLFLDFCSQGTLLDAVNKANDAGTAPATGGASNGLEELVAMFFTIEILKVVESFHMHGFVHGDLKIDNCLVRLGVVPTKSWSTTYDPSGAGGWSEKGLKVIDFGRSIDVGAFSGGAAQQRFTTQFVTSHLDCPEMQAEQAWTYEPDYFGIASIAFTLLFGRFIEITTVAESDGTSRFAISQNFRRYQQANLWTPLFHALLNPRTVRSDGVLPIVDELALIRTDMEDWLVKNSDKNGKNLKGLLKKMEIYSLANFGR